MTLTVTLKTFMRLGRLVLSVPFSMFCFRSICLLMQAALPCLLFSNAPTEVLLRGGTNADMAPQVDYTLMVSQALKYMYLSVAWPGLTGLSCAVVYTTLLKNKLIKQYKCFQSQVN